MAVDINIGSKLDAKGFKQAETAIDKLNKNAKNLARNFGVAFGTAAIVAYSKNAVKAAAADQAAQASLAQTLKNLGYESAGTAESLNTFISSLERQTGILDDQLRPAMDRLLRATGSVTESQKLMSLALDISAGTGKDLGQVSQSLQKAYLGQTQALGRLGVGLSKAELKSSNFEEITARLSVLFAGQAKRQAESYQGSIDKLAVASNNASETIGGALIDSMKMLGGDQGIGKVTDAIDELSIGIGETIVATTKLITELGKLPVVGDYLGRLFSNPLNLPKEFLVFGKGGLLDGFRQYGKEVKKLDYTAASNATAFEKGFGDYAKILNVTKKLTAEEIKQLNAKKLKAAIDKANLALNKGTDVFDMNKIQLAAAEKNQVEQLGKVTSQAQLLAITNDLARLRVKQDIIALEDAIASKDVKAIESATAKLNADTKILGVLTGQELKMTEIKSILDTIAPKDLINLDNLNEAIRLLGVINAGNIANAAGSNAFTPTQQSVAQVIGARVGTEISGATDPRVTYGGQRIDSAGNYTGFNPEMLGMTSGGSSGTSSTPVSITVNTGVGDPNAIAEAITQVVREAQQRGTLTGAFGTL